MITFLFGSRRYMDPATQPAAGKFHGWNAAHLPGSAARSLCHYLPAAPKTGPDIVTDTLANSASIEGADGICQQNDIAERLAHQHRACYTARR
ncbi:MAG: hypothetical protein KIT77_10810 [Caldilinea sp.]|nr:hypothetical protein [Caldilineaceae bacterium]MCB9117746.1 hypothetical protein [Caldilineaceae bacterium]MCB9123854.1 hypothetical protein [Caldilineaceae bacterium]MCW5841723.1 hypothetical protein [Caldilinea sp.]